MQSLTHWRMPFDAFQCLWIFVLVIKHRIPNHFKPETNTKHFVFKTMYSFVLRLITDFLVYYLWVGVSSSDQFTSSSNLKRKRLSFFFSYYLLSFQTISPKNCRFFVNLCNFCEKCFCIWFWVCFCGQRECPSILGRIWIWSHPKVTTLFD